MEVRQRVERAGTTGRDALTQRLRPIRAWQLPERVPVVSGQAAAVKAALDRALVRSVGALPVCEGLGLREAVNRHCWPDGAGPEDIDVGRMALVLILNRLQAPQPLVHVETWLVETTLPDVFRWTRRGAMMTAWPARWILSRPTWTPSGRTWWWPPSPPSTWTCAICVTT